MIAAGIAALMISGLILTTPVFASQSSDALSGISEGIQQDNNDENNGSAKYKVRDLTNWQDLANLRLEAKTISAGITTDVTAVRGLIAAARTDKDKAALQALKAGMGEVQTLREEFRQLRVTQRANWQLMKAARQDKDLTAMQSILDEKIIPCREAKISS